MNIEQLSISWGDTIESQMFLFHSDDEVKEFFSKFSFDPETLIEYGILVKFDSESEEYACEYHNEALRSPVINPNPYMGYERESLHLDGGVFTYNKEDIELDKGIFTGYPYIMYIHNESSFDRTGETSISIAVGGELKNINTVQRLKSIDEQYSKVWKNKLKQIIRIEEKARLLEH